MKLKIEFSKVLIIFGVISAILLFYVAYKATIGAEGGQSNSESLNIKTVETYPAFFRDGNHLSSAIIAGEGNNPKTVYCQQKIEVENQLESSNEMVSVLANIFIGDDFIQIKIEKELKPSYPGIEVNLLGTALELPRSVDSDNDEKSNVLVNFDDQEKLEEFPILIQDHSSKNLYVLMKFLIDTDVSRNEDKTDGIYLPVSSNYVFTTDSGLEISSEKTICFYLKK